MVGGGVTLSEEQIRGALSRADLLARDASEVLREKYPEWVDTFNYLSGRDCPRTYLPVAAILLTARSMKDASELDVLDIQQQTSPPRLRSFLHRKACDPLRNGTGDRPKIKEQPGAEQPAIHVQEAHHTRDDRS